MNFIGIDFGTSNSLAALGGTFAAFPDGKISNPTVIYFPQKSKQHYVGNEAIYKYLNDLDEHLPVGRLMLSVKSLLPEANFDHTTVTGFGRQTPDDLAARFIVRMKEYAEKQFGEKFDGVVLGRPVEFNELAETRLANAARIAGFKEVSFRLEPVAAALSYELTTSVAETVCVVDLGGGTSDICIIETAPDRVEKADRAGDIKAVSGVNQAGDELSSRIMRQKLAPRFGAGSVFYSLGKELPFPIHLIERISKWHRINMLKDHRFIGDILEIKRTSDRPEDVERLYELISYNYGYELFQAIDTAKKELSSAEETSVKFRPLDLRESLTRSEFETVAQPVCEKIKDAIMEALRRASLSPSAINRVLVTGGTSQIPLIYRMIAEIFGEEKLLKMDYYSSVANGLGTIAARLNKQK
ncbi:MAG TPA: Hsp70 family protein [Pyrinomonadaceae bacterium]|nr:Hsp70 family protein [Pyrinomonadaceae bacterium]